MDQAQMFSLSGDSKLQEIIFRLKFISKIRKGEKLNVKGYFIRDNDSMYQRAIRSIRNYSMWLTNSEIVESKEATLAFIQETINEAITLIVLYRSENEEFSHGIANILVTNLEASKAGIRNSISTYRNDRKFISEAEAVIQTLEMRIKNMQIKGLTDSPFIDNDYYYNNEE